MEAADGCNRVDEGGGKITPPLDEVVKLGAAVFCAAALRRELGASTSPAAIGGLLVWQLGA